MDDLQKKLEKLKKEFSTTKTQYIEQGNMLVSLNEQIQAKSKELVIAEAELKEKQRQEANIKLEPIIQKEVVIKKVSVDDKFVAEREGIVTRKEKRLDVIKLDIDKKQTGIVNQLVEIEGVKDKIMEREALVRTLELEYLSNEKDYKYRQSRLKDDERVVAKQLASPKVVIKKIVEKIVVDDKNVHDREKAVKDKEERLRAIGESLETRERDASELEAYNKDIKIELNARKGDLDIRQGKIRNRELLAKNKQYLNS